MSAQLKDKDESHSEQQAKAQLESIIEMVAALDEEKAKEAAADEYAKNLSRERCVELLLEASIDSSDDEPIEDLREAVSVNIADGTLEPDDFEFEFDEEEARQTIQEDALSVQVRGDWHTPGDEPDGAVEFELLLCTGGPAVRIVGDLDRHNQPERPRIQHQDWGTPWAEYFPTAEQREAMQTYCEQFYFGD